MTETITSRKNDIIQHLKKLGSDRNYRMECGEFLCDGRKLLKEAVLHGATVKTVALSEELDFRLPQEIRIIHVPDDLIKYISPLKNPQPVLFACEMKPKTPLGEAGKSIIVENIQDPGNLGTILRSANAFGIDHVLTVGNCADPYNPKTLRASMGAIFRQKIIETDLDGVKYLKSKGVKIYGAALDKTAVKLGEVSLSDVVVAIGNEGNGLSSEMLDLCDRKLFIPMSPECESLNAAIAASVIMWEMRNQ